MNNPARIKRLLSTHAHLLSAKQYVSLRVPSDIPDSHVALTEVEQRLSEEALVSCMTSWLRAEFRSAPEAASGETWSERPRRWITWSELRRTVPAFYSPSGFQLTERARSVVDRILVAGHETQNED